jgi:hypothetical protein
VPILEAPEGRRDGFVDPYFKRAKADEIVAILRARVPGRILVASGNKKDDRWHLQITQRWVIHYNFYLNDARWGRIFVRMCPYSPFSARVCLNQHHWLANQMRHEKIDFQQCSNAFLKCSNPSRLQELADSLSAKDLLTCGQKWLRFSSSSRCAACTSRSKMLSAIAGIADLRMPLRHRYRSSQISRNARRSTSASGAIAQSSTIRASTWPTARSFFA